MTDYDFNDLKNLAVPPARRGAREAAVAVAVQAFKRAQAKPADDSREAGAPRSLREVNGSARKRHVRRFTATAASAAVIALAVPLALHVLDTRAPPIFHRGALPRATPARLVEIHPPAEATPQPQLAAAAPPAVLAPGASNTLSLAELRPVEIAPVPVGPSRKISAKALECSELQRLIEMKDFRSLAISDWSNAFVAQTLRREDAAARVMFHDFARCDLAIFSSTKDHNVTSDYFCRKPLHPETGNVEIEAIAGTLRGCLAGWSPLPLANEDQKHSIVSVTRDGTVVGLSRLEDNIWLSIARSTSR